MIWSYFISGCKIGGNTGARGEGKIVNKYFFCFLFVKMYVISPYLYFLLFQRKMLEEKEESLRKKEEQIKL